MYLPKKKTAVRSFAQRYAADLQYRILAVDNLRSIIRDYVAAISLNPVFGSLWRGVCNDRENEARHELIADFGLGIDCIADTYEKARVKTWLEECYDFTTEVLEAINSVSLELQFPCVCLDPTLSFIRKTTDDNGDENEDNAIALFRRDEVLEIGQSCDYKILRRLGHVLTSLTYINSEVDMPTHIARATEAETPRISIAPAAAENQRRF